MCNRENRPLHDERPAPVAEAAKTDDTPIWSLTITSTRTRGCLFLFHKRQLELHSRAWRITPSMPRPTPIDAYPTETSSLQTETEHILQSQVPLDGSGGSVLNKKGHLELLVRNLIQGFPARYMSQDASQPWLMFWTLQSLSALQVAVDPD